MRFTPGNRASRKLSPLLLTGLAAVAGTLTLTASAHGASGSFDRTWGEGVDSAAGGSGFEICTVAVNCVAGLATAPALGGEMDIPDGVATDSVGNVYVVDYGHQRVQKFNSSGTFERAWGGDVVSSGPGNTGTGFEICVAANGDTCKIGVSTVAAPGGELDGPRGVTTDSAGNVYVADNFNNRVQKFDSSGTFERAWGEDVVSSGPGDDGGGFEICVAADGDICQAGLGFNPAPALGGEMSGPQGIAADAAGNVYVSDSGFHNRVQKFGSTTTPPVITPPIPTIPTVPATPAVPAVPAATGRRAAALRKCKRKQGRARARCKQKAKKLPV